MSGGDLLDEALAAQRALEVAQEQWREDEQALIRARGEAIRAALDAGAGRIPLQEALGISKARLYAMVQQGRR